MKEKTVKSSKHKSLKRKVSESICHGSKIAKTEAKTVCKDEPWDEQASKQVTEISDDASKLEMLMDFRQNFVKWQRQQQVARYKEIKESKDFSLKINVYGDHAVNFSSFKLFHV